VCNSADGHGTKSPLGYPPFQSVNFPFFVRRSLNRPPNRRQVSSLPRALTVSRWLSPSVSQLCLWRYLISPLPFFLCPLVTPAPIVPPCTAVFSTPYHSQEVFFFLFSFFQPCVRRWKCVIAQTDTARSHRLVTPLSSQSTSLSSYAAP
jgi:hypothetical protein